MKRISLSSHVCVMKMYVLNDDGNNDCCNNVATFSSLRNVDDERSIHDSRHMQRDAYI